jgi:23S rRNA pseudouridine2605 synthase
MHPSAELAREYICRVHGTVTDETLERLRQGVSWTTARRSSTSCT